MLYFKNNKKQQQQHAKNGTDQKNETLTWNQSENEGQVIVKYLFQLI